MGVAMVPIATNETLLVTRIATRKLCSNTMQWQQNIGVAIDYFATRRNHCNKVSLLPHQLNGFYSWLRILQRFGRFVATDRSSIATFPNGCYRRHMLLPHYLGWFLQLGHPFP
jgi:hypothetical protein